MTPRLLTGTILPILCCSVTLIFAEESPRNTVGAAVLLHAPFDGTLDATKAAGDPKLYSAMNGNRKEAQAGLPADDLVVHAKGTGKFGDALRFTKKMKPVVFFRGEKNLGFHPKNWSGAVSVWLKLDPDKDLEPGYCDPLQLVAQAWGAGNMFIEFSKKHAAALSVCVSTGHQALEACGLLLWQYELRRQECVGQALPKREAAR